MLSMSNDVDKFVCVCVCTIILPQNNTYLGGGKEAALCACISSSIRQETCLKPTFPNSLFQLLTGACDFSLRIPLKQYLPKFLYHHQVIS